MKTKPTAPLRRSMWRIAPLFCAAFVSPITAQASSHSDAPLIKQDPQANLTDVYTFVGTKYNDPSVQVLNVLVSVRPFSEPGDGVIYERFADDAVYSIHITDPNTAKITQQFDFMFSSITDVKNPDTILSYGRGTGVGPIVTIGDAQQNFTQTYEFTASKVSGNGKNAKLREVFVKKALPIAPPNVGARTTPAYNGSDGKAVSGAVDFAGLDSLTKQAISQVDNGIVAWAGPREDGFYADTPGIFDFLNPRIVANTEGNGLGQDGGGVDGFKGFNVLTFAIQIPLTELDPVAYQAPLLGARTGVGVYASVSRSATTTRRTGAPPSNRGGWVQVNRLGNPLFNEVLVALRDKDRYNWTSPVNDEDFRKYAEKPEVAFLINAVLFADPEGDGPLVTTGRTDLAAIFLPDVVRVDTTTGPVPLPGQAGFNRLSLIGGDTKGWPNGRRIGDDVVDIALSAVASGPSYSTIVPVGDNVDSNDQLYNQVFPYLGTPHAGPAVNQRQAP